MAASTEDIRTVRTIIESIQSIIDRLTTRAISRAAEQECFEFMELLTHAIDADLHPGRVGTLMFTDQVGPVQPFNALACLMHPQLALSAKLRCGATKCFKSLFNAVTSKDCASYLTSHAADSLQHLEIVQLLLQTVTGQHVDPDELSAASELLFVVVMQLPKVRDALAVARPASDPWIPGGTPGSGVSLLIRTLANSLMVRPDDAMPFDACQHIVAVLRVVSDVHADAFISREMMFLSVVVNLMERELSRMLSTSKKSGGGDASSAAPPDAAVPGSAASILTLLLEICGEIVLHFPSFYRMNVLRPSATLPTERDPNVFTISLPPSLSVNLPKRFCNLLAECAGNQSDSDLRNAAASAIHQIFAIEGSDAPLEGGAGRGAGGGGETATDIAQPVMRTIFEDRERWNRAISEAGTAPTFYVEKLRLCRSLVASALTNTAVKNIERQFMEVFPALCVLLDSSRSSKEPMREAAMIVSLMCAKCPDVRKSINAMVTGFEQWAVRLRGTVVHILAKQGDEALLGTLIVDVHQCLLNDGEQLMPLDNINFERVAAALLTEQERRMSAAQPVVPLAGDLLETARLWPKKAHDVAARLAQSLLMEGVSVALVHHHRSMPADVNNPALQTAEGIATRLLNIKNTGVNRDVLLHGGGGGSQSPDRDGDIPSVLGHDSPSTHHHHHHGGGGPRTPRGSHPHSGGTPRGVPIHNIHVGETTGLGTQVAGGGGGASTSTPRTPGGGVGGGGSRRPSNNKPPGTTRSRQFLSLFGDAPDDKPKTPFRPASSSTKPGSFTKGAAQAIAKHAHGHAGKKGAVQRRTLTEALRIDAVESDDAFVSLALMMHLPITYGVHYNRSQKTVIRSVHDPKRPSAPWVTPVFRESQHTWSINDIMEGDLYVLFVPFHKLSVDRLQQEVISVERHMLAMRKQLILTPATQRTRRWFLNDMMNFILPKTDLLLRDMINLLQSFGVEDVVYNMGVIRLMDEKSRESENVVQLALEVVDAAMPNELLRFSSGRLRDVLHSGNIQYAVRRLREHYQGVSDAAAADGQQRLGGGVSHGGDSPAALAAQHRRPGAQPSHLNEIDREIAALEKKVASSNWGQHQDGLGGGDGLDDLEDEDDDDVESVFDNLQGPRGPTAAERRAANFDGGKLRSEEVGSGVGSDKSAANNVAFPDKYMGSAEPPAVAPASKSALHPMQSATGIPASNFKAPSMDEFEAMYAAVEAQGRR